MKIPLANIQLPDKDLRAGVDAEGIAELADSFAEHGQLQPIGVREIKPGQFEVVFGARRTRAATALQWLEIEAVIVENADEDTTAARKLIENVQRVDLTPIEEAYGLLHLIGDASANVRTLQKQTGKSRDWIRNRLALLDMPEDLQAAVQAGRLGVGVAKALSSIESDEVRRQYVEYAEENGVTASQAEVWASNAHFAEAGIAAMNPQVTVDDGEPVIPQIVEVKWNCFGCQTPKDFRSINQLVLCKGCQESIMEARR